MRQRRLDFAPWAEEMPCQGPACIVKLGNVEDLIVDWHQWHATARLVGKGRLQQQSGKVEHGERVAKSKSLSEMKMNQEGSNMRSCSPKLSQVVKYFSQRVQGHGAGVSYRVNIQQGTNRDVERDRERERERERRVEGDLGTWQASF